MPDGCGALSPAGRVLRGLTGRISRIVGEGIGEYRPDDDDADECGGDVSIGGDIGGGGGGGVCDVILLALRGRFGRNSGRKPGGGIGDSGADERGEDSADGCAGGVVGGAEGSTSVGAA